MLGLNQQVGFVKEESGLGEVPRRSRNDLGLVVACQTRVDNRDNVMEGVHCKPRKDGFHT